MMVVFPSILSVPPVAPTVSVWKPNCKHSVILSALLSHLPLDRLWLCPREKISSRWEALVKSQLYWYGSSLCWIECNFKSPCLCLAIWHSRQQTFTLGSHRSDQLLGKELVYKRSFAQSPTFQSKILPHISCKQLIYAPTPFETDIDPKFCLLGHVWIICFHHTSNLSVRAVCVHFISPSALLA